MGVDIGAENYFSYRNQQRMRDAYEQALTQQDYQEAYAREAERQRWWQEAMSSARARRSERDRGDITVIDLEAEEIAEESKLLEHKPE